MDEQNDLNCHCWKKAFQESIDLLKFKQEEYKRKSDDYLLQSNEYMQMRLDLETLYYKKGLIK